MEEENKNKGVNEKLDEVIQLIGDKSNKNKNFWLPFWKKPGKNKVRKGWITVQQIFDNRNQKIFTTRIEEQTILVDGIPRLVTADDIIYYGRKPWVIIPSWSVKPF